MNQAITRAWRAWRIAAERGYGSRDNTAEHMRATDARIAKLKAKYETLASAYAKATQARTDIARQC